METDEHATIRLTVMVMPPLGLGCLAWSLVANAWMVEWSSPSMLPVDRIRDDY